MEKPLAGNGGIVLPYGHGAISGTGLGYLVTVKTVLGLVLCRRSRQLDDSSWPFAPYQRGGVGLWAKISAIQN